MRCPNCNKFVPFDEPQATNDSVDISGTTLTHCATVTLNCAECGTELKSASLSGEAEINHHCADDCAFEISDEGDPEPDDRFETKDRHGKPIKNARYQKHFYGFTASDDVKCTKCGEQISVDVSDELPASSFDELV